MFVWEGLYAIAVRLSSLLSFNRNSLVKAKKVTVFVSFPRKTGCYNSHLSIRALRANLFSILKEQRKFIDSNGLLIIILAHTSTSPWTVVASLDLKILNTIYFSISGSAEPPSNLREQKTNKQFLSIIQELFVYIIESNHAEIAWISWCTFNLRISWYLE